jgi:hypothetical protein
MVSAKLIEGKSCHKVLRDVHIHFYSSFICAGGQVYVQQYACGGYINENNQII